MAETISTSLLIGLYVIGLAVPIWLWRRDVIRPGSFKRAGLREVRPVDGLIWLVCAVAMYMTQFVGQAIAIAVIEAAGLGSVEELAAGRATLATQTVLLTMVYLPQFVAAAALIYLLRGRAGPRSGLTWRWQDVPRGVGAMLLATPTFLLLSAAIQFVVTLVTGEPPEAIAHSTLDQMLQERESPWFWGMCAAVVIGAPISEEVTYRLFIQSALLRWTGNAWLSIGITSVWFGLMHAGSVPWYGLIALIALGAMFGVAFERTGRIGVPIVMHAVFNASQIALGLAQST